MPNLFTVVIAGMLAFAAAARASSTQFVQNGWSSGATLTVAFSGQDADGDLATSQSELTAFDATWTTPLGISTHWIQSDIKPDGFLFTNPDNYLFFVANAEFSLVSTAFEGEALASVFDALLFPVDSTVASPTEAPEPVGLTGAGLVALWARQRRKRMQGGRVGCGVEGPNGGQARESGIWRAIRRNVGIG